ncbi:Phospholipid-lipopolysaccharide ABC transporter [hydrothermal vent metagenome]|uniref:Phospholipid-lipopolysaccharide ABC transporter n=1 Tax=hydrothermal vent metagenome TaxID=652676 RepID=A0A1W1BET1_9ZZZZ
MLSKFSKGRYHSLSYKLFENYLGRNYRFFLDENSSNLTKTIITEAQVLTNILSALLFLMSEVFVVVLIYSFMVYIDWKITLLLSLILFFNSFVLIKTISKRIKQEGINREIFLGSFYEILNRTFGNFKMIKLKSYEQQTLEIFSDISLKYSKSNIVNETLSHFPRLFLEALGFIIVVLIIVYLVYEKQDDISSSMALISMFILGLYRLMPSANRILSGYNQILFSYKSLDIIYNDMTYTIENLGNEEICFNNSIEINKLSFSYVKNKPVLKNISLVIEKGSKIAIIGESGSGKSTLIDIIMGLYESTHGGVYVDDILLNFENIKSWRSHIGYIPQHIYLFDGDIAQNVAFGDTFDEEKVKEALRKANILEFLESHHDGIYTDVGENGLKLSGGQKQRVAIARALYDDSDILILDEATSALDSDTEKKIMNEIYNISKNKTLIIVAHRLSTIEECDKIYKLENGELK